MASFSGGILPAGEETKIMAEKESRPIHRDFPTITLQEGNGRTREVPVNRELFIIGRDSDSDIVICRSGAMSVSELCAAGAASILVPFVVKTTNHQLGNARYMAEHGASIMLEQAKLTPEHLFGILHSLKRERILNMAQSARALARRNAAAQVADMIEATAGLR